MNDKEAIDSYIDGGFGVISQRAERLPCSCRRAVHHGISEPERFCEGHERQADWRSNGCHG